MNSAFAAAAVRASALKFTVGVLQHSLFFFSPEPFVNLSPLPPFGNLSPPSPVSLSLSFLSLSLIKYFLLGRKIIRREEEKGNALKVGGGGTARKGGLMPNGGMSYLGQLERE